MSDQWRAYEGMETWNPVHNPNQRYTHRTVNHEESFVDQISGAHTQMIESCWAQLKTKLLRCMKGTNTNLLPNHLAEAWWRSIHNKSPFLDIIDEIAVQYPL